MARVRYRITVAALVGALAGFPDVHAGDRLHIDGAGGTFPAPLYAKWFEEFHRQKPDIEITYQAISSATGIRRLLDGIVDFAASDCPMTEEQLAQAKTKILHFPAVLGAAVAIYNIPGVDAGLKFTPDALAGVFLGKITKWNAAEIATANPDVHLPGSDIVVVHRSEGSGTTYIWTDYLSKVSEEWKSRVGKGTAVDWPVGLGEKGSAGVSELVRQTPNSIGYVELTFAVQKKVPYGEVQNAAGKFSKASFASVTAAAVGASASVPDDFRVSITNALGETPYPISSFTWLLIPQKIADVNKKKAIADFLKWMITDGQRFAEPLSYVPLPKVIADRELVAISQLE